MYMCKKSLKLFINLEINNLKLDINGYISSIKMGTNITCKIESLHKKKLELRPLCNNISFFTKHYIHEGNILNMHSYIVCVCTAKYIFHA